jgi:thioredoxin 1
VDENPETMKRFGIHGIPTLILFKDGKPVERIVGFRPKPQLMATLEQHLGPPAPGTA